AMRFTQWNIFADRLRHCRNDSLQRLFKFEHKQKELTIRCFDRVLQEVSRKNPQSQAARKSSSGLGAQQASTSQARLSTSVSDCLRILLRPRTDALRCRRSLG